MKRLSIFLLLAGLTGTAVNLLSDSPHHVAAAISGQMLAQSKASSSNPAKEIPFSYSAMKTDLLIRLADEPRLQSPIKTNVTPTQSYTIFFREPMKRATVESAIRKQAALPEDNYYQRTVPAFAFRWASDRQLHLTVTVPAAYDPQYVRRIYRLDVNGAAVTSGNKLANAPTLTAVVEPPAQLWRISLDGKRKEQLTSFQQPYDIQLLDDTARYMLVSRATKVCECDATYEKLKAVYDRQTNQLVPYPSTATVNYMGPGMFVADVRGFFYTIENRSSLLASTARIINKKEYIHGASFSKDRRFIMMAVGTKEQEKDLDLVIRELASGKERRFPQAMKGGVWYNQVSSGRLPISFYDEGRSVFFAMDPDTGNEKQYQYRWKENRIVSWKSPSENLWGGYTSSSDGVYQLYPNGGLYKGARKISDLPREGVWLPGTHIIADTEEKDPRLVKAGGFWKLTLYHADQGKRQTFSDAVPRYTSVVGGSSDGKWLYLVTGEKL